MDSTSPTAALVAAVTHAGRAAVFAVLVAATFGAFFLAQRLKHAPTVIQQFMATPVFSPNRDGRFDRARVSFKLKQADDVTVKVVDDDGDDVRTLAQDAHMPAYRPTRFTLGRAPRRRTAWRPTACTAPRDAAARGPLDRRAARDPQGHDAAAPAGDRDRAPAGQGRAARAAARADGRPADVIFRAPGRRVRVLLFRTSPGRTVAAMPPVALPDADAPLDVGRDARRAPAPRRGPTSRWSSRATGGEHRHQRAAGRARGCRGVGYGATLPGRGGITVR